MRVLVRNVPRVGLRRSSQCAALVLLTCLAACDSKSGSTAPSPTPTPTGAPPTAAPIARFTAINIVERSISLTWPEVSGADRYIIEAGSSSGASDLGNMAVPPGNGTFTNVTPRDGIYFRVKAGNAAGFGPASEEARIDLPDMRDIIEALFFGSGRYSDPLNTPRNPAARMRGYTAGPLTVRVPHEIGGAQFDLITRTVNELNAATNLSLGIERVSLTPSQVDQLSPRGVTIVIASLCNRDCAISVPIPAYDRTVIGIATASQTGDVWAHELGHAIGLQHVSIDVRLPSLSQVSVFNPHEPVMGGILVTTNDGASYSPNSSGGFVPMELEAIRRVYASGLRAGSSIADFIARDLIKP